MKLSSFAALFLLLVVVEGKGSGPRHTLRRKISSNMVKVGGSKSRRDLGTGDEIGDTTYDYCGGKGSSGKGSSGKGSSGKGSGGKGNTRRRGRRLTGCSCSKGDNCYEDADPFDDPFLGDVPSDDTPAPGPPPTPAPGDRAGSNQSLDVDVSYDPWKTPSNDANVP